MKHMKIAAKSRDEIERRVLLAFGINQATRLRPGELMMAVGITRKPVDETPGLEAAIDSLVRRGVLAVDHQHRSPAVVLTDQAALPVEEVAALREAMGLDGTEEAAPFSRIVAVPDPTANDWLAEIGSFGWRN